MSHPMPTELNLHRKSKVLEIAFNNGDKFSYPAEYLRCFSPSAEVQGHTENQKILQVGKENVNILHIDPVGNYAVCLHFDDEHNTGIYSWETLYNLGKNYKMNWDQYLADVKKAGHERNVANS